MLASWYCGWKGEHWNIGSNGLNRSPKENLQKRQIASIHITFTHYANIICFPGPCTNFDKKRNRSIYKSLKCHLVLSQSVAIALFLILAAEQGVYCQKEIISSRNSLKVSGGPGNDYPNNYENVSTNGLPQNNAFSAKPLEVKFDEDPSLSQIKVQSILNRKSSSSPKTTISETYSTVQSVSMNRNVLLNFDSMLQRQLREKARLDSLESIKMHILMRLNLKKLPNITKPISVPQNILDNFYKDYNVSSKNTIWRRTVDSDEFSVSTKEKNPANLTENASQSLDTMTEIFDESSSSQMQGDDANTVNEFHIIYGKEYNEDQKKKTDNRYSDEYESILSHVSSIYIFPEQIHPHVRHNRKTDVLRFKIDTGTSKLSYATLHIYIRGWDWMCSYHPELIQEIKNQRSKDIVVTIHRAVRRSSNASFTHKVKMFEFHQKIPLGLGQWVNVDLKPLFEDAGTNMTQEIFIKGVKPWMKPLIVTTDNASKNPLTIHIEIGAQKKHRRKRSVYMDCTENDHDMRCCRYPLKVNFTSFGWHFVVAPTSFDAYFCSGDCRVGYLEQYPHTHLAALTTSATPCCSPTKMSSLSLLYFDDNHNLVLSVIPNMSVEGCSCS
ncbi:hypothetical protein KR009_007711 [Drosophila setifemur]|nr:hypothetical protein KR009_007711 [Drosophila setifemur]